MTSAINNQGSIWRKWDLHIHTPASYDYKNKSLTYQELAKFFNESSVDAFAITDHWTLNGFFELKPYIAKEKLVLPGIEIRIDKASKQKGKSSESPLHALVIFPEYCTKDDIERKFLHQIRLCGRTDEDLIEKDIIELGKRVLNKSGKDDKEYFKAGCSQAYVSYEEVIKATNSLDGIICLTYEKYGGFENIDPINDSTYKSNLVRDCHLVETSKDEIRRAFFEHQSIVRSCGKKTPCFRGSDAHKPDEIGRSYTWIKSELSFEGLKQIIYFPKERVSFSTNNPTYSYPRIKSLSVDKVKPGHCLSSLKSTIRFSDNLTSIIGHPSIGKSTFLEIMAFLFDVNSKNEVGEKQCKIDNLASINPELIAAAQVLHGKVTNTISRGMNRQYGGDIGHEEFPVEYLNQGYIDKTARDPRAVSMLIYDKMDTNELDQIRESVKNLRTQLEEDRSKYLRKFLLQEKQDQIKIGLQEVNKFFDISESGDYKELDSKRKSIFEREKEVGDLVDDITELIEKLEEFKEELQDFSIDAKRIESLLPSLKIIEIIKPSTILDQPIKNLQKLLKRIESAKEYVEIEKVKDEIANQIQILFEAEGITYTKEVIKKKEREQKSLDKQLKTKQNEIKKCEDSKDRFARRCKQLDRKLDKWHKVNNKCMQEFNDGLAGIEVRYDSADKEVWLKSILTHESKNIWARFTPKSEKSENKFTKPDEHNIQKMIDKIKTDNGCDIDGVVQHLIDSLQNGKLPISGDHEYLKWLFGNKSVVIKEFLRLRLQEFAEQGEHQIYYDGKNISKEGLSFTERCGALLEIILEKGEIPLILDQPEENLGSRYITREFIGKILEKKHHRQIIIVSHNPNSVILADSDLIIAFDREEEASDKINIFSGAIEAPGIKDVICEIIEGGEEAFDLRAKRYKL